MVYRKIINHQNTYKIVGIDSLQEEIIGFTHIGYGQIPLKINRPLIETIFRRI